MAKGNRSWHPDVLPEILRGQRAEAEQAAVADLAPKPKPKRKAKALRKSGKR